MKPTEETFETIEQIMKNMGSSRLSEIAREEGDSGGKRSDEGKKSNLFGFQHINTEDSYFGTLQPVTGAMITADNATYFYKGFQIQSGDGAFKFTPSFTPGLYFEGDGKDLGHVIEFKTELQISFEISSNSEFGFSYNHISNASLGNKNPGANSYMFNFIKKF